tara:strand:+ start:263 stop:448 length:186 start_codon:yes stop_codon:yes gene_type:complete
MNKKQFFFNYNGNKSDLKVNQQVNAIVQKLSKRHEIISVEFVSAWFDFIKNIKTVRITITY